jgi:hypothetical protein
MPLYKNSTSKRVNILGVLIEPGEIKATHIWLSPLPAGVTLEADAPMYNPTIYSALHNTGVTIPVPEGETRFNIHIQVLSGQVSVLFNSAANTPALELGDGAKWNVRVYERSINDIRLSGTSFSAIVTIERAP